MLECHTWGCCVKAQFDYLLNLFPERCRMVCRTHSSSTTAGNTTGTHTTGTHSTHTSSTGELFAPVAPSWHGA